MKKLLLLLPIFLFACCDSPDAPSKADKGIFLVQSIESLDDSKILCKYEIISETLSAEQGIRNKQKDINPRTLFLTDTTGKYKIGDSLFLGLKSNYKTEPEPYTFDTY